MPEANHNLSLKLSCISSGIKGVRQSGQVFWSWSIHRSKQLRWKICRQFVSRRISSSPSNSYKQTAQLSGGSTSSENFTTGSSSRINAADTEWSSECVSGRVGNDISGSRKSPRPKTVKMVQMNFLMKPRRVSTWTSNLGRNKSVYPTGKPILDFWVTIKKTTLLLKVVKERKERWDLRKRRENGKRDVGLYRRWRGEMTEKGMSFGGNYCEDEGVWGSRDVEMCLYYTLMSHSIVVGVQLSYDLGRSLMNTLCFFF